MKQIIDTIHSLVNIDDQCVKIIDTPGFQRLRLLKQTAHCHYVFPCMTHSRFEHSLGTYHIAESVVSHIAQSQPELDIREELQLLIKIAALCHDLGHGPFSHSFDGVVTDLKPKLSYDFSHEEASTIILENHILPEVNIDVSTSDLKMIKTMICSKPEDIRGENGFMYQIVSNPICGVDVDKLDYIERDGYYSNTLHSKFPELRSVKVIDGKLHWRDKHVATMIDLLNARARLHRQLYKHRVVVAVEMMYRDIMTLCNQDLNIYSALEDLKMGIVDPYLLLNDQIINTVSFLAAKKGANQALLEAKSLLHRIDTRNLYELVCDNSIKIHTSMGSVYKNRQFTMEDFQQIGLGQVAVIDNFRLGWGNIPTGDITKIGFHNKSGQVTNPWVTHSRFASVIHTVYDDTRQSVYCRSPDRFTQLKHYVDNMLLHKV